MKAIKSSGKRVDSLCRGFNRRLGVFLRLVHFDNYCRFRPVAQQAPQVKRGELEFGSMLVKK